MAEFDLIQSNRDALEFATFLRNEFDARFFVDESASTAPPQLDGAAGILELLQGNPTPPLLFVTSPRWQRLPPYTSEVHTEDGRHFWSVRQRYGGPAFTWMLSRCLSRESRAFFTAGAFGDYPWYYEDPNSSSTFDRPSEMTTAYRATLRYTRRTHSRARVTSTGRAGPWVGPDAERWHEIGVALGSDSLWTLRAAA